MRLVLILSFLFSQAFCNNETIYRLVKLDDGSHRVLKSFPRNATEDFYSTPYNFQAVAHYQQLINETGWAFLQLQSNSTESNENQVYSVGYLEGHLTSDVIYMHWFNTLGDFCQGRDQLCKKLDAFLSENMEWVDDKLKKLSKTHDYWNQVDLFYIQVKGIYEGYSAANKDPSKNLTFGDILWLNLQGDFEDLIEVLNSREENFDANNYLPQSARGLGHCSALIKILPDGSDLFVAQDTWNSYQSMIRFQKKYILNLRTMSTNEIIPGYAMSFSSYAGVITSGDDFYLLSSGLAAIETTIGNGNASLWQYVQPKGQVLETVRSVVANRLAKDGRTWTNIFSHYNSGTYNNQWMIVDYNKFATTKGTPPSNLQNGVLWVLEQIPSKVASADMTKILRRQGYWPSYNVAAFSAIFNMSGNQEMVKKYGDWFSYEKTPRALIFQRDQDKVKDLKSLYNLMRYNDYKHDPLSKCDCSPPYSAENAISARCDLNPANGIYPFPALGHRQHGATDAKITSSFLFNSNLMFLAVSGPTFNVSLGIPPFQWSTSDFAAKTPHLGHPDVWLFGPVLHQWL